MATQTITVAAFQLACAECADAIASENWATAAKKYANAEAVQAGLELNASSQGLALSRRETLNGLRSAIETAREIAAQYKATSRFITSQTRHTR